MKIRKAVRLVLGRIIASTSTDKDKARKEYILNILLLGSIILASVAFLTNLINFFEYGVDYHGENPLITGGVVGFLVGLLFLSKKGKATIASFILITILVLLGISGTLRWGADSPQILILYALIIVIAGILINRRMIISVSLLTGIIIISAGYLESNKIITPDYSWKARPVRMGGAVTFSVTLAVVGAVSWLSNKEIEKALKRARFSEAALRKERDLLEDKVEERTKQLKLSQIEQISQLYKFIELGKLSTGLFHDLVGPLAVVSLNLKNISKTNKLKEISDVKESLEMAVSGTKRLERFTSVVRKQLQNRDIKTKFWIDQEVQESIELLNYKAKKQGVMVNLQIDDTVKISGNHIKFSQVITNLISNAIDSYIDIRKKKKIVNIILIKDKELIEIRVQDFGIGIKKQYQERIFQPLFTTKSMGIGIGLSMSKEIIEKEFKGQILVESKLGEGSTFIVKFKI